MLGLQSEGGSTTVSIGLTMALREKESEFQLEVTALQVRVVAVREGCLLFPTSLFEFQ